MFDTSEVLGINSSVDTFHSSFIKEHPEAVQKYVDVWHKTTTYIMEHPDEAYAIIAKNNNVNVEDVVALVQTDKILHLQDNKISFSYAAGYASLHSSFKSVNRFMYEKKLIDKYLDDTLYINNTFINNLE